MLLANIISLLIYVSFVDGESKVRWFKEIISYENRIGTYGVIFQDALDKDNCWRLCNRHAHCASYYKHSYSNECRLISGIFTNTTFVSKVGTEVGWKYFAVDNACPISSGYTYNSTANLCIKLSDVAVSYTGAHAMCNADVTGARVVQIRTLEQQTVLVNILKTSSMISGITYNPRIDGHRLSTSDSWVNATYLDGTTMSEFFWRSGENTMVDGMDCIKLLREDGYAWSLAKCSRKRHYICEVVI